MGKRALIFVFVLAMMVALCGCVFSDTVTERVYDNAESSAIDPDIPPMLKNSATAEITSDKLPRLDLDADSDSPDESMQSTPKLQDAEPNTQVEAPKADYNASSQDAGETATQSSEDSDGDNEQGSRVDRSQSNEGTHNTEGDDDGGGDGDGDDDDEGNGDDNEGDDDPGEGEGAQAHGGTGSVYSNDPFGAQPDIPDNIDSVAAVGNAAVIVSMVSGRENGSSLVACDADTKTRMASVLAAKGIWSVPALWEGDGTGAGSLSESGFQSLLDDTEVDLVFITEGDSTLTEAQIATCEERNIDVFYLPKLTSATRVKFAVRCVGMVLAKGGVEGAEERYNAYLDRHDALVQKYLGNNGGMTGGFDFDTGSDAKSASEEIVTLYIDDWDDTARLSGTSSSAVDTSKGVGVATMGYTSNPVSYYLSVGGVLNNAAAPVFRNLVKSGKGIAWQFAQNELDFSFNRWSGLKRASADLASILQGGIYTSDLMYYTDYSGSGGYGLGTDSFPAVVVKSGALKDKMVASSSNDSGIYYPYPTIHPAGSGTTVGFFVDQVSGTYVEASIGAVKNQSILNNGRSVSLFGLYVNPKGLVQENSEDDLCSWTNGSQESVLEASWAYYKFRDGSQADFRNDVSAFYSDFYGYALSDAELDAIEAGTTD